MYITKKNKDLPIVSRTSWILNNELINDPRAAEICFFFFILLMVLSGMMPQETNTHSCLSVSPLLSLCPWLIVTQLNLRNLFMIIYYRKASGLGQQKIQDDHFCLSYIFHFPGFLLIISLTSFKLQVVTKVILTKLQYSLMIIYYRNASRPSSIWLIYLHFSTV